MSYHNSSQRVTITFHDELPQLFLTTYGNSLSPFTEARI